MRGTVSSNRQQGFKLELPASSLESCRKAREKKWICSHWSVTSVMLPQSKAANPERSVSLLPCRIRLGGKPWARRLWSLCVAPGPPVLYPLCPHSVPPLWILLRSATSWSWSCACWCLNTGRQDEPHDVTRLNLCIRILRSLDWNLELCHPPPGPEARDRVGRPPVLPVVLCAVGLRAGAVHQRFLWQRGIPGRCEDSRTGWSHLQGLPHPSPAPQRAQSLRRLPEVSRANGTPNLQQQRSKTRHLLCLPVQVPDLWGNRVLSWRQREARAACAGVCLPWECLCRVAHVCL